MRTWEPLTELDVRHVLLRARQRVEALYRGGERDGANAILDYLQGFLLGDVTVPSAIAERERVRSLWDRVLGRAP